MYKVSGEANSVHAMLTDPKVGGAVRELGHDAHEQLAAELGQRLALLELAVVVRLAARARHHLLLHGDQHDVQQLRHHVQQVPLRGTRLRVRRVLGLFALNIPTY